MSSSENQSAQPPQSAASTDAPPEARLKLSPKPVPPKDPVMPQSRDSSSVTASPMSSPAVTPPEGSSPTPLSTVVESTSESELSAASMRQHPIPPASEPMQYRAIGLLYGKYTPSEEQFTRGTLEMEDGQIHAVLLGRVMSLVKKHVDLTKPHLWVVYPRTRDKHHDLHMQIVGIWEPENLAKAEAETDGEGAIAEDDAGHQSPSELQEGFFSIRGEVLFCSEEGDRLIVRIQQSPKKGSDREKAFKLTLLGQITGKTVGYFWDLNVQRQGNELVVIDGRPIGLVPPRKRKAGAGAKGAPGKRPWKGPSKPGAGGARPFRRSDAAGQSAPSTPREPAAKPMKRPKPGSV